MNIAANANDEYLNMRWKGSRLDVKMQHPGRPVFTHDLIKDLRTLQTGFRDNPKAAPDWLVFSSSHCDSFCYGGDLAFIEQCVRTGDYDSLNEYAHNCIDVLLDNLDGSGADVLTIGVIDGDAHGAGFEAAMTYDYLVATPRSTFSFPELDFGVFPGMGAQVLLCRKIGAASATRMIREGVVSSAKQMADLGIVTHIAENDDVDDVVSGIISRNQHRKNALIAARRAMAHACPMNEADLRDIVDIWTKSVMELDEANLQRMMLHATGQDTKTTAG